MTVSRDNSLAVYKGIKAAGIRYISALPETWLVYLLQLAEDDPEMTLVEVAKEEEAIGIAAGAYFAGKPNALLMHLVQEQIIIAGNPMRNPLEAIDRKIGRAPICEIAARASERPLGPDTARRHRGE